MFDLFRSRETAVRYLLGGLLMVVAVSMVVTLIPGFGTNSVTTGDNPTLANIAGDKLTAQEALGLFQRAIQGQNLPQELESSYFNQFVGNLIQQRAAAYQAEKMGITASDDEVLDSLVGQYPQLFPNGVMIPKDQFQLALAQQGLTPQDLVDETRSRILLGKLESTLTQSVVVTPQEIEQNYKEKNMKIHSSNLCTEIFLPTNEDESFVCDLSSMNILHYDEWKDTDAVELLVYLLDAVMSEFIQKASKIKFMERAVRFAGRHRAIGVGWLGWHSYLQSKMIPFESNDAKRHNVKIAKNIKEKAYAASAKMAQEYGEPEVLQGYGRRHTTLMAIAPTKSSSFILGQVSEGIEPHRSNYYIKDLAKGKFTIKNSQLEQLLESKGENKAEVWDSILRNSGSVQHLTCLTDEEKAVFKTFAEISQKECIIQAAQRQKYIDQGQSLNLMIHPSIPIKDVNALMIEAWELGIKSLYYQMSVNAAQSFSRDILACVSCQA